MNLAAFLLLFLVLGVGFIFVHLLAGKLIRPSKPGFEKGTIYECGEPTIGSAWVQFDLRFYVVALLFVIFDVEVAFFFPWAEVFGRANAVAATEQTNPMDMTDRELREYAERVTALVPPAASHPSNGKFLTDYSDPAAMRERWKELAKTTRAEEPKDQEVRAVAALEMKANVESARGVAVLALFEIVVFFGVLLVGFAYLWRRGDLEWVRSLAERGARTPAQSQPLTVPPARPAAAPTETVAAAGH
jgi:NADH-quinone oxidoreductase subunit A